MNMYDQRQFARALTQSAPETPCHLFSGKARDVEQRFDIYRNNVRAARISALRQVYPVLDRLLGERYFTAVAAAFVSSQPPTSAVLHCYGDGLGEFLMSFPAVAQMPWLRDIADLERARLKAFHAANQIPFKPIPDDSALSWLEQPLAWHPSLALLRSTSPLLRIWQSQIDQLPMPRAEDWQPENVLVWRPQWQLHTERISSLQAELLAPFRSGSTLSQVLAFSSEDDAEAIPALAELVAWGCLCPA